MARAALQGDGEGASGRVDLALSTPGSASDPVAFALDGWRIWPTPTTGAVQVGADGVANVRVTGSLPAGAWGTLDDLELVRMPEPGADTTELRARRDAAAGIDASQYVESSTVGLSPAIERADIVLGAASPDADAVDGALRSLNAALDALVPLDDATAAPGRGMLSQRGGTRDGDYVITMNLRHGENATRLRLFENGVLIATVPLTYGGTAAQSAQFAVTGRPGGRYVYTGELVNSQGTTAVKPLTVKVKTVH